MVYQLLIIFLTGTREKVFSFLDLFICFFLIFEILTIHFLQRFNGIARLYEAILHNRAHPIHGVSKISTGPGSAMCFQCGTGETSKAQFNESPLDDTLVTSHFHPSYSIISQITLSTTTHHMWSFW